MICVVRVSNVACAPVLRLNHARPFLLHETITKVSQSKQRLVFRLVSEIFYEVGFMGTILFIVVKAYKSMAAVQWQCEL